ncbi:MAG: response regulator [Acidobacteria bacterium]|nr:response regulator [Acidobacteriota bacterium]
MRPSALFNVLLAVRAAKSGGLDARTGVRHGSAAPLLRFASRVLVADDNTTNQRVAQLALENLGCHVDLAGNGAEAIIMLQQLPYDLVFMDCEMPELDGFEATREIRRIEARISAGQLAALPGSSFAYAPTARPRIPIVAMTAKALAGDREKCLVAGMDDYLGKPVQLPALLKTLERWLPMVTPAVGAASEGAASERTATSESLVGPSSRSANGALDRATIAQLRGLAQRGNTTLFARILESYQSDAGKYLATLRTAIAENEVAGAGRAAHALKGASLTAGALTVANLCRQLEALITTNSLSEATALLIKLEVELQRVYAEIAQELQAAPST